MPSKSSTAKPQNQGRRFKVGKTIWVLEDGKYHRGIVAELKPHDKILVDFPDFSPTLCAQYDEWDENIFSRKPKPKKPKKTTAPPVPSSKKRKASESTSPQVEKKRPWQPTPRGRRETGNRRAQQRQEQEDEEARARARMDAQVEGKKFEERAKKAQKIREDQVAANLLNLKESGLQKTKELLVQKGPPSIFDEPVLEVPQNTPSFSSGSACDVSGMKFTRVVSMF